MNNNTNKTRKIKKKNKSHLKKRNKSNEKYEEKTNRVSKITIEHKFKR